MKLASLPGRGRPGSRALHSVAFANPDGSLVTIMLNETDAAAGFALAAGAETLACTIPSRAIQTSRPTCARRGERWLPNIRSAIVNLVL